jgi:hypothetical protein
MWCVRLKCQHGLALCTWNMNGLEYWFYSFNLWIFTKFWAEKYDFQPTYKGFFMEKMAQISHSSKKIKFQITRFFWFFKVPVGSQKYGRILFIRSFHIWYIASFSFFCFLDDCHFGYIKKNWLVPDQCLFLGAKFCQISTWNKKNSTYTKDFPLKTWPKFTRFWGGKKIPHYQTFYDKFQ